MKPWMPYLLAAATLAGCAAMTLDDKAAAAATADKAQEAPQRKTPGG